MSVFADKVHQYCTTTTITNMSNCHKTGATTKCMSFKYNKDYSGLYIHVERAASKH